jgi:hypothetical protein
MELAGCRCRIVDVDYDNDNDNEVHYPAGQSGDLDSAV